MPGSVASANRVEEVGGAGGLDHVRLLQLDARRDPVEEADAAAEDDRDLVDEDLVEETGAEQLLDRLAAPADRDVFVTCRLAGQLDRALRSLGDEVEGGLAQA